MALPQNPKSQQSERGDFKIIILCIEGVFFMHILPRLSFRVVNYTNIAFLYIRLTHLFSEPCLWADH